MTEQDWRGILAVLTTCGYFSIALAAMFRFGFAQVIAIVGFGLTPEMLVLNWYFKAKEERNELGSSLRMTKPDSEKRGSHSR